VTEVDVTGIEPYQGIAQVKVSPEGMLVRWLGDKEWHTVPWWAVMQCADVHPPKLREELDYLRERARWDAVMEVIDETRDRAAREAYERGYMDGKEVRIGQENGYAKVLRMQIGEVT
jgi:hypothetical protein